MLKYKIEIIVPKWTRKIFIVKSDFHTKLEMLEVQGGMTDSFKQMMTFQQS